jgi:hypothetical protein
MDHQPVRGISEDTGNKSIILCNGDPSFANELRENHLVDDIVFDTACLIQNMIRVSLCSAISNFDCLPSREVLSRSRAFLPDYS